MAGSLKYLNDENFERTIESGVTLVDFYADWCGPCRMIAPIIEELSHEYHGKANIAKMDVDGAQETAVKFNVTSIPTVILFVNGKESKRVVGVRDKKSFQTLLDAAIAE
jgi:thioredoxin 1